MLNGLNILAPEDHTDEYDKAIGMLEMSVDDTVLITHDEYRQYVLDEWFWKDRNLRALASSRTAKASYTP